MKQPVHVFCGKPVYKVEQAPIPTLPGDARSMWWCSGCMSVVPDHEVSK